MTIFEKAEDYDAFLRVLEETWRLVPLPICAFTVMRYVERNPLRANFVERAEAWRWGSCWARRRPAEERPWLILPDNPALPRQWIAQVNKPQTEAEVKAIRECIRRGSPFGDESWTKGSVVRLGLQSTLRPRGRPRKES